MVTQTQSLPPGWRDFEVYRLVKVDRNSTREAATALGLSQTRVCQILTRVDEYLGTLLLATDNDEHRRRDALVAEQIAAEQVDNLNRQAMLAFRRSQAQVMTIQEGDDGQPVYVPKWTNAGDPRYLLTAARLAIYQAKLPTAKLAFLAPTEDDQEVDSQAELVSPPEEDCSADGPVEDVALTTAAALEPTTNDVETTCVLGVGAELVAKLRGADPVQPVVQVEKPQAAARLPGKKEARRRFFGS